MTLKELQQMIKEELNEFQGGRHDMYKKTGKMYGPSRAELDKGITYEAEDDIDVSVTDSDVDLDDETGAEGEDDVLRQIYDLLAAHFEGGGEEEIGDEEDVEDLEGGEEDVAEQTEDEYYYGREEGKSLDEESADLEELSNQGVGKSAGKTSGANAGYKPAKTTHGDKKLHEAKKTPLQERFQKLANIIK